MKPASANTSNSFIEATVPRPEHPYATANRLKKVEAIVATFRQHGITAKMAYRITDDEWDQAGKAVGINSPSRLTREGVLRRLADKV